MVLHNTYFDSSDKPGMWSHFRPFVLLFLSIVSAVSGATKGALEIQFENLIEV